MQLLKMRESGVASFPGSQLLGEQDLSAQLMGKKRNLCEQRKK